MGILGEDERQNFEILDEVLKNSFLTLNELSQQHSNFTLLEAILNLFP